MSKGAPAHHSLARCINDTLIGGFNCYKKRDEGRTDECYVVLHIVGSKAWVIWQTTKCRDT